MATTKKISFLCSKCGKTFAGKQSAFNHANEYHKTNDSKEFVDQLMQEEWQEEEKRISVPLYSPSTITNLIQSNHIRRGRYVCL